MDKSGIYIHIPFCQSKCAYCDFYSFKAGDSLMDRYTDKICNDIARYAERLRLSCDTLYFGGGTPSLLGGERIARIVGKAKKHFGLGSDAEITLEANPADRLSDTFRAAAQSGVNRLSLGVQSGVFEELKILGRRHTPEDVVRTVSDARAAGIDNISLDLMLGIPKQTPSSLAGSVDFLTSLSPSHISAYILKIEENTPFGKQPPNDLPNDDQAAELYLAAVKLLAERGYKQYEISNFAKDGQVSRHNMKYWTGADYLGLGPAAHSLIAGKRFYFPADIDSYLAGCKPVPDGEGGGALEYLMLRLRLSDGISFADHESRFGREISDAARNAMKKYAQAEAAVLTDESFCLNARGFLISNTVISDILEQEEQFL